MISNFKKIAACFFSALFFYSTQAFATCTPHTVSMSSGMNNITAFTADGLIGTDNTATYYVHWDNSYLYLGWTGGRTNYSSDLFYASIDTDPTGSNGTTAAIENVGFSVGRPDYYVVYENNASFYGIPASNGNAFEIYDENAGTWNFVSRTGGDDGTSSQIVFSDGPGEVRVRVSWADLGGFSPGSGNDLRIIMWTNNSSGNFSWSSLPSENPTGATPQTLTHGFTFSSTEAGTCPAAAAVNGSLPVELANFFVKEVEEKSYLQWSTFSEINNSHFEIERSTDSGNWKNIGSVDGSGDSFEKVEYSFVDKNPVQGLNYYRLKQVDFDGAYSYSAIVSALFRKEKNLTVFPNPFTENLTLQGVASEFTAEVFDLNGRLLSSIILRRENQELNLNELLKGIYLLRILDSSGSLVDIQRIVKI